MSALGGVQVLALEPGHAAGLAALFERTANTCHCRYWHFSGDKNAWLARCAHAPEANKDELLLAVAGASDELCGVVALSSAEQVVGWLKLAPAESLRKLYEQRLYRGLSCLSGERAGVLTVGCVLVDEAWRRKGLARALVRGAVELGRASGARSIEAFPRRGDDLRAEELWTGPDRAFRDAGFEVVNDFGPYPVLKLTL